MKSLKDILILTPLLVSPCQASADPGKKIQAIHAARIQQLESRVNSLVNCLGTSDHHFFSGQVNAYNGFDYAKKIYSYKAPSQGTYNVSIAGKASTNPYGSVYIVTGNNKVHSQVSSSASSSHLYDSNNIILKAGETVTIMGSRAGGGGHPKFDISINIHCRTI
jgi:hypothetical protein